MAITQRVIRLRLMNAGIRAHEKQVESTMEIYNVIEEKFAQSSGGPTHLRRTRLHPTHPQRPLTPSKALPSPSLPLVPQ